MHKASCEQKKARVLGKFDEIYRSNDTSAPGENDLIAMVSSSGYPRLVTLTRR